MTILDPKALQAKVQANLEEKAVLKPLSFVENGVSINGEIYVKKLEFGEVEALDAAYTWKEDPDDPEIMRVEKIDHQKLRAAQIYATICIDEDGTPFFKSVESVLKSYPNMCKAMWSVSNEVNIFWGKLTTTTSKDTNSGQNLQSTESVATPSKVLKSRSQTGNIDSGNAIENVEEA